MLTKEQKKESIARGEDIIGKSAHMLFADFTAISTADIQKLRAIMREQGGAFAVIKKRLLRIALKNKGINFDPMRFERQAGIIASPKTLYDGAGKIYALVKDLAKAKKELKILGGIDVKTKQEITAEDFVKIAKLPTREALLTHIAFMFTMPMKKIMAALGERAKTVGNASLQTNN